MDERQITVATETGVAVVALLGEHDLTTAAEVGDALRGQAGAALVVDLTRTSFLDSSILGALIAASRDAERSGSAFTVVLPDDPASAVRRVFDLTGLISALSVAADVNVAIEMGRGPAGPGPA